MISIAKLSTLPRSQRYRKIAKTAAEAEECFSRHGTPLNNPTFLADLHFLRDAALLVAGEEEDGLSPAAQEKMSIAAEVLRRHLSPGPFDEAVDLSRALNDIHRLLMAAVGVYPADWDFDTCAKFGTPSTGRRIFPGMQVYLEDLRSPFNVGSIFRAAESFGVERILLSPLCASPEHPRARRTAMGTTEMVPWDTAAAPLESVFALETGGTPLKDFAFPQQGVMLVGSEELGLSPGALELADRSLGRVTIPTWGLKGSLNVAVAFGIVCQAWAEFLANVG
jgi:TrmH family RNA methyltransferase